MWKVILTVVITLVVGLFVLVLVHDYLYGQEELAIIATIAVSGGAVVFFNEYNKKDEK